MKFSDKLAQLRKANNLSQEQLADQLGVTRQSVSKWESGDSYPDMAKIIQLCKVLNCTLNDIMDDDVIGQTSSTNNNEIKSESPLKRFFDDFIKGLTKTINMFMHMTTKSKVKMILEMAFVFILAYVLGFFVYSCMEWVLWRLFDIIPGEAVAYIFKGLMWLIMVIIIFIAVIVCFYIFKIRYLDYYVTITDENATQQSEEEVIDENKSTFNKQAEPRIVIRDPKHSTGGFLDGLASVLIFIVKLNLAFALIPVVILIILLIAGLLFILLNALTASLVLSSVGGIIFFIVIVILIINCVFSHAQPFKLLMVLFLSSLLLSGSGIGLALSKVSNLSKINYLDNIQLNSEIKELSQEELMNSTFYGDVEYVVDDSQDKIIVEFTYPKQSTLVCRQSIYKDEVSYFYDLEDGYYFYKLALNDFVDGVTREDYDESNYLKVKITCNSANMELISQD